MIKRRNFIKQGIIGTSALAFPNIRLSGAKSPGNRLNIACIGVGGIAGGVMNLVKNTGNNNIAFADVDFKAASRNINRYPDVPRFNDYRRMFDKYGKKIDAAIISTPDHTHFTAAMEAIERGIHVFIQKPLAHDIWQTRTLLKAAKHHKVITQMGNQGHASSGIRSLKEWYDSGLIGDVKEVYIYLSAPEFTPDHNIWVIPPKFPPPESKVPDDLDWDCWLGPAAYRPYTDYYAPLKWRSWWDFGNGGLGDLGVHGLDGPMWVLGLGLPAKIEATVTKTNEDFIPEVPSEVILHFPARKKKPPVKIKCYTGNKIPFIVHELKMDGYTGMPDDNGVLYKGEKHWMASNIWQQNPSILLPDDGWYEFKQSGKLPERKIPRVKGGPHKEWINAIKGDGPLPGSRFEYSALLTEAIQLGVLAIRMGGGTIEWDTENMRVKNNDLANKYIKQPVRPGWEYGEEYWKS